MKIKDMFIYLDGLQPSSAALALTAPTMLSFSSSLNRAGTKPDVRILLINSKKPSSAI